MIKIENTEIIESMLGRWHPGDLAFIEFLEYSSDRSSSTLKLTGLFQRRDQVQGGWPSSEIEFYRVSLLFRDIRSFFVTEFGLGPKQIMGFDIIDVSNKGWENVNFEVEDYENNQIRFLCNSVEIISIEEVDNRY